MNILAIETSILRGSLSLHRDNALIGARELPADQRTARCLVPQVEDLLRTNQVEARDLDLVAVSVGPGSFTGLRIGVTFAKTLAYGAKAEIIGIPTGEAIALQAAQRAGSHPADETLEVLIDAQRKQLFTQTFQLSGESPPVALGGWELVSREDWLKRHESLDSQASVSGPGLAQVAKEIDKSITPENLSETLGRRILNLVPESHWQPRAIEVGSLGWNRFQDGKLDSMWTIQPDYGRQSAAEEKAKR